MKESSSIYGTDLRRFSFCPRSGNFRGVAGPEKNLSQISPVYTTKQVSLAKKKKEGAKEEISPLRPPCFYFFCFGAKIDHFRCIKIQSQPKCVISRLWGINSYKSLYLFPRASRRCLLFRTLILIYRNWSISTLAGPTSLHCD